LQPILLTFLNASSSKNSKTSLQEQKYITSYMVLAEYKKQVFILNSKPKIEDPVEKRHMTLLM
jgi:hypothetical protein